MPRVTETVKIPHTVPRMNEECHNLSEEMGQSQTRSHFPRPTLLPRSHDRRRDATTSISPTFQWRSSRSLLQQLSFLASVRRRSQLLERAHVAKRRTLRHKTPAKRRLRARQPNSISWRRITTPPLMLWTLTSFQSGCPNYHSLHASQWIVMRDHSLQAMGATFSGWTTLHFRDLRRRARRTGQKISSCALRRTPALEAASSQRYVLKTSALTCIPWASRRDCHRFRRRFRFLARQRIGTLRQSSRRGRYYHQSFTSQKLARKMTRIRGDRS
mmetsp:Transcript_118606/g.187839  ORF Transcript_118606/g.187839 Transcript_118606/m.187839 type:complete len:272 (-) Transcript_118606:329-1144(-)